MEQVDSKNNLLKLFEDINVKTEIQKILSNCTYCLNAKLTVDKIFMKFV